MANGSDLSDDEFCRLEDPLGRVHLLLVEFGMTAGAEVWRGDRSPSRRLRFQPLAGMERWITVSPYHEQSGDTVEGHLRYNVPIVLFQDSAEVRLLLHETVGSMSGDLPSEALIEMLARAASRLQQIDAAYVHTHGERMKLSPRNGPIGYAPGSFN